VFTHQTLTLGFGVAVVLNVGGMFDQALFMTTLRNQILPRRR